MWLRCSYYDARSELGYGHIYQLHGVTALVTAVVATAAAAITTAARALAASTFTLAAASLPAAAFTLAATPLALVPSAAAVAARVQSSEV